MSEDDQARLLQDLLDGIGSAAGIIDEKGRVVYANRAAIDALRSTGHPVDRICPEVTEVAQEVLRRKGGDHAFVEPAPGQRWRGRLWVLSDDHIGVVLRRESNLERGVRQVARALGVDPAAGRLALSIALGRTSRDIAERTKLPIGTIQSRSSRLYRKLHVRNRAELAALVISQLVSAGD